MNRTELERALRDRSATERGPLEASAVLPRAPDRRVAVAYPSPYRAGMSSLGFQRITALLRQGGVAAERCFLPDDVDAQRRSRLPPLAVETLTPLGQFPLIAVSFAYEAELVGLFDLLDLAGIPLLRTERTADHPRILLGGPISMASPAFLAPFVDALLLGEAEDTVVDGVQAAFDRDREGWLDRIEALPGGWVPERGRPIPPIAKASDEHLPARSAWLAPQAELSDMFLVEGERGCHRMCTFCVMRRTTNGGMRLVTPERVLGLVPDEARKVGLVGAAISDHPQLVGLLETLVDSGRQVSVSSLRADRIARRPDIARLLRQSGARTLTTASDGATEALRKTLTKGTSREHLLACAEQARELRYDTLKLYMMLGVPGETDGDVDTLAEELKALAAAARPSRLALGVAAFVAKRATPLDGEPFAGIKVVEKRIERLRKAVRGACEVRPVSVRWAWIEHALAQGGPEAGLAMLAGWRAGGRFADYRRALEAVPEQSQRPWAAAG
ncbi:MAG: radical SAM protein [Myxococcota bacterium]